MFLFCFLLLIRSGPGRPTSSSHIRFVRPPPPTFTSLHHLLSYHPSLSRSLSHSALTTSVAVLDPFCSRSHLSHIHNHIAIFLSLLSKCFPLYFNDFIHFFVLLQTCYVALRLVDVPMSCFTLYVLHAHSFSSISFTTHSYSFPFHLYDSHLPPPILLERHAPNTFNLRLTLICSLRLFLDLFV